MDLLPNSVLMAASGFEHNLSEPQTANKYYALALEA
jgi:hypothetical protein